MEAGAVVFFVPFLLLLGALAGFLSGLFGIGGGVILVPGMFFLLTRSGYDADLATHVAIGTSLAVMFFGTLSSLRAHTGHEAVDFAIARKWSPWVILGVVGAMVIADLVKGVVILWIFAFFLLFTAIYLGLSDNLKEKQKPSLPPGLQPFTGLAIGGVSALLGIGGAMLSVPAMLMFRVPVHRAIGTAPAFGMLIAVFGAFGSVFIGWGHEGLPPFSLGYVSLAGLLLIAPASYMLAPLGANVIHKLPVDRLQRSFAFLLFLLACRLFYSLILGIGAGHI